MPLPDLEPYDVICLWEEDSQLASDLSLQYPQKEVVLFASAPIAGVTLFSYGVAGCDLEAFVEFCRKKAFLRFFYVEPQQKESLYWCQACQQLQWQEFLSASIWSDFGLGVFANLYGNRQQPWDPQFLLSTEGALQGMPAVICGGGPSLREELEAVKAISDKAWIIAGGAAIPVLRKAGVSFDAAVGLDPDPGEDRAQAMHKMQEPLWYSSSFSSAIVQGVQGARLRLPSAQGSILAPFWEDAHSFEGGGTVGTFAAALAAHLGCSPIVLVGMDLSCPASSFLEEGYILWHNAQGKEVATKRDWVLSARFLESLCCRYPAISWYNSSREGLAIQGMEQASLDTVFSSYASCIDKEQKLQRLISSYRPSLVMEEKGRVWQESVERCLGYVQQLLEWEYGFSTGLYAIVSHQLEEEVVFSFLLKPLWEVWQWPFSRCIEGEQTIHRLVFYQNVLSQYQEIICAKETESSLSSTKIKE